MDSLRSVITVWVMSPFTSLDTSLVSGIVFWIVVLLVMPFTMVGMKFDESSFFTISCWL